MLGKETDTQDLGGQILNETETNHLTKAEVEEAILSFLGSYDQIPPMYSALKVGGKKLYRISKRGQGSGAESPSGRDSFPAGPQYAFSGSTL